MKKKRKETKDIKLKKVIAEKDKVIAEKDKVITEKNKVIAEKNKVIVEKDKVIAEKDKVIAELKKTQKPIYSKSKKASALRFVMSFFVLCLMCVQGESLLVAAQIGEKAKIYEASCFIILFTLVDVCTYFLLCINKTKRWTLMNILATIVVIAWFTSAISHNYLWLYQISFFLAFKKIFQKFFEMEQMQLRVLGLEV